MSRNKTLDDFERRFGTLDLGELRRWRDYWNQHAMHLKPKVRKEAMKRVHRIERLIAKKERDSA